MIGSKNIILTGFMGTGKTTVGKAVARKLNRLFLDTDEIIKNEQNRTISEIFENDGEDHFRRLERQVVTDIYNKKDMVMATGGGTLLDKVNLKLLSTTGIIFCLAADIDILFGRLSRNKTRPLIANKNRNDIKELLENRKNDYKKLPNHVDTTYISQEETAEIIINMFNEFTIKPGQYNDY